MADKRLGRGLRALIPDLPPDVEKTEVDSVNSIKVSQISPNPFQPREEFDEQTLEELKQSISERGVIQPITVRKWNDGYQLVAGERRLRAVSALQLEYIPAYVIEVDSDEEMIELALIENIQREDLNPVDVARAYEQLLTTCSLTQEQVAKKVGKDRSTITNFLRLLKLPVKIQESLKKNELSMGHARALVTIDNSSQQLELWNQIVKKNLSVRQVEKLVKRIKETDGKPKASKTKEKPYYLTELEEKLQHRFGTKVQIQPGKKGGKIEIEYYSEDELDRLIEIMADEG